MKKILLLLLSISLNLLSFNTPTPSKELYVNDLANVLSDNDEHIIDDIIRKYKSKTTTEFSVLIIESLDGNELESYATQVFKSCGIGNKNYNNGILILLAIKERKLRVETGYGIEPYLTDIYTKQKSKELSVPQFKNKNYFKGIYDLISDFQSKLGDENFGKFIHKEKLSNERLESDRKISDKITSINQSTSYYSFLFYASIILTLLSIIASIVYLIDRYKQRKLIINELNKKFNKVNLSNIEKQVNNIINYKAVLGQSKLSTMFDKFKSLSSTKILPMSYDQLFSYNDKVNLMYDNLNQTISKFDLDIKRYEYNLDIIKEYSIDKKILSRLDKYKSYNKDIESSKLEKSISKLEMFIKSTKSLLMSGKLDSSDSVNSVLMNYDKYVSECNKSISIIDDNLVTWSNMLDFKNNWTNTKQNLINSHTKHKSKFQEVYINWGTYTNGLLKIVSDDMFNTLLNNIESTINSTTNESSISTIQSNLLTYNSTINQLETKLDNPYLTEKNLKQDLTNTKNNLSSLKSECSNIIKLSKNSDVGSSIKHKSISFVNGLSSLLIIDGIDILHNKENINKNYTESLSYVRKMKKDIEDADEERRRKKREEERRLRDIAAAAAIASSWSSSSSDSSYSSGGSSWDSGSSYGGGDSGGSGSSSDF